RNQPHHLQVDGFGAEIEQLDAELLGEGPGQGHVVDEVQVDEDVSEPPAPLPLVAESAAQLQLVDDARLDQDLPQLAADRLGLSLRAHFRTRARYSSRVNTPRSMSSSTIARRPATSWRWVVSRRPKVSAMLEGAWPA